MGSKQMARPRRRSTVRVDCGGIMYTTEDGEQAALREGQWVEFKAKVSARSIREILRFGALEESEDIAEIQAGFADLVDFLAGRIVAWSWLDIDGDYEPLPPPSAEVLADLDLSDLMDLLELYADLTQTDPKVSLPS